MNPSRRSLLLASTAWLSATSLGAVPGIGRAATAASGAAQGATAAPVQPGGTLSMAIYAEPDFLVSAFSPAGPPLTVSTKLFDPLVEYDAQFRPVPKLASSWHTSADGLTWTLRLREGVRWHDGKPFTSADVAWSLQNVWQKLHPQGRIAYAHVTRVDTPDPHTVVLKLDEPSPYLINALGASVSQVLPRHLYEGRDVLSNPANNAPVGTGPYRFSRWQRGAFVELVRNPDYWVPGRPYLDKLVFRVFPDSAAAAIALETNVVQLATSESIPQVDIRRIEQGGKVALITGDTPVTATVLNLDLNLDRPALRDLRVRQALYHAIDRSFIVRNVYSGFARTADAPLPPTLAAFHTDDVPKYPFDPARAEALLDAAGLRRGADGTRLALTLDSNPKTAMMQTSQYIRGALSRVGVKVDLHSQDFGQYVKRIYTDRDFDLGLILGNVGPDPVIGLQRFYASNSFRPGVPFSNGAHYVSPQADDLLFRAAREQQPAERTKLYAAFQKLAQTDLPRLPLVSLTVVILLRREVRNLSDVGSAMFGNFADVALARG
ncbi:MAG: ABC transporter substrate-binding protein [Burkholderia gladioli]